MIEDYVEMWDREDGDLGNGWIDAYNEHPKWWDQIKLLNGVPVTPNPDRGLICQTYCSGGRAAFYKEFGSDFKDDFAASLVWCGNRPYEGTPLIHVNPDDDDFGIGAWYVGLMNSVLIGFVGRAADKFRVVQVVPIDHINTLQRRIDVRSSGDEFSIWISKTDIREETMEKVGRTHEIPEGLKGATMHGGAIDVNQDYNRPANIPAILAPYKLHKMTGKIHECGEIAHGISLDGKTVDA